MHYWCHCFPLHCAGGGGGGGIRVSFVFCFWLARGLPSNDSLKQKQKTPNSLSTPVRKKEKKDPHPMLSHCSGLNWVPLKCMCSSPYPGTWECNCIWRQSLQRGHNVKLRPLGWPLIQHDWFPHKKRKFGHKYTHTEKTMWRPLRKGSRTIYIPNRKVSEVNPADPLIWTCSFHTCEKIHFCHLSQPVCRSLLWQP